MTKIKVIFSGHFYNEWGYEQYLLNGYHTEVRKYMATLFKRDNVLNLDKIHAEIDKDNPDTNWRAFTSHGNFLHYYRKHYGIDDIVMIENIVDDGSLYIYPIASCYALEMLLEKYTLNLNQKTYNYEFIDIIDPVVLAGIRKGFIKLVIDVIHDPLEHINFLNRFEEYIIKHNIDPANVVIIGGNKFDEYYENYPNAKIKITNGYLLLNQLKSKTEEYKDLPKGSLGYKSEIVNEEDLDIKKVRPKKFLCLNRNLHRSHRWILAYFAVKYNLLDNSLFSFIVRHGVDFEKIKNHFQHYLGPGDYDDIADKVNQLVPYEIDTVGLKNKNGFTLNNNKKEFYENTYINIISETSFEKGSNSSPFISEKTLLHPIVNLQPFICVGNPFTLETLKEFGFKTFHPYIDETYDSCIDFRQRFNLIEHEIKRLNDLPHEKLHELYYSMKDILIYNKRHGMTLSNHDPYEQAFNDIRNWYEFKE